MSCFDDHSCTECDERTPFRISALPVQSYRAHTFYWAHGNKHKYGMTCPMHSFGRFGVVLWGKDPWVNNQQTSSCLDKIVKQITILSRKPYYFKDEAKQLRSNLGGSYESVVMLPLEVYRAREKFVQIRSFHVLQRYYSRNPVSVSICHLPFICLNSPNPQPAHHMHNCNLEDRASPVV